MQNVTLLFSLAHYRLYLYVLRLRDFTSHLLLLSVFVEPNVEGIAEKAENMFAGRCDF